MTDRHTVPTHLDTPDGIGNVTISQGAWITGGAMVAMGLWFMLPPGGPLVSDALRLAPSLHALPGQFGPLFPALPCAAVIAAAAAIGHPRTPSAEHGASAYLRFRTGARMLAGAELQDFIGEPRIEGKHARVYGEYVAMWEVPSVSMRLATEAALEAERARWARFLDGIPCPVQTTVRATPVDLTNTLNHMLVHGTPESRDAGHWLLARNLDAIARQRFLTIRAADLASLERSATAVDTALKRANLKSTRLVDEALRVVLNRGWHVKRAKGIGPKLMTIESDAIQIDGTWHSTVAFQTWPGAVRMDFLEALTDGSLAVDVHQVVERHETSKESKKLRDNLFKLESSGPLNRKRKLAHKQTDAMLDALEENREHVFTTAIYLQVHGKTRAEVVAGTRHLLDIAGETGGVGAPLRWEQADGQRLAAGVLEDRLLHRSHRVDTSSMSRAYPWSASELAIPGGIPWGRTLTGERMVIYTPWAPGIVPNPNVAVYGTSGSGKGFAVKVATSRLFFAGVFEEMFALDQAEEYADGEYGRWARYCGGEVWKLEHDDWQATLAGMMSRIATDQTIPPVVVLNVAELTADERAEAMVQFKRAIWTRAAKFRKRRALILDELASFVDYKEAAREAEHIARFGRHHLLSTWFMTQRAMDALASSLGGTVQSLAGTKLFCMQNPGEISDITKRLRWTDSQVEAISALGIGQAMIEVGLNRQTFEVTYSPAEYEMANTDPRLDTVTYIGSDGRSNAPDDLAGNLASVRTGRAGGDLQLTGRSQTDLPLALPLSGA